MEILNGGGNSVFDRLGTYKPMNVENNKKRNRLSSSCSYLNATELFHHPNKKPYKPSPPSPSKVLLVDEEKQKMCKYWIQGKCVYGDKCRYLHQCYTGRGFSLLNQLPGHQKPITSIAFPSPPLLGSSSYKVYSGSRDGTVRVWDCQSGNCIRVVNLGAEIGCLMREGQWVFVGIPNSLKAWNTHTDAVLNLTVEGGQVHSLATTSNHFLFAGTQEGSICVWSFEEVDDSNSYSFHPINSLKGHNGAVISLIDGDIRLYSGSIDTTIRVWDTTTMHCIQILSQHTSAVTSVLCWKEYLISCSLDHTIKVWAATEDFKVVVVYNHEYQHGVLSLSGIHDCEDKPMLLCSSEDNVLHIYDLPTFQIRGKIFSNKEVRAIAIGSGGLFFTGDGTGLLSVWKLSNKPSD